MRKHFFDMDIPAIGTNWMKRVSVRILHKVLNVSHLMEYCRKILKEETTNYEIKPLKT